MSAFLPPSSSVTSFTPISAASRWMASPVASLPMKPIRRTAGWRTSARPAAGPRPTTADSTPGGRTSANSSPIRSADSGAVSGGFRITALPATSGAAIFAAANMIG
jgi:hypothetical protein